MASLMELQGSLEARLLRLNTNIARLSKILLSTPSLDALLSTLSYALLLLSTLPASRNKTLPSASSPTTRHTRLKALSALLSDTRTTLRLFSLPLLWTSFVRLVSKSPQNALTRRIAYVQAFSGVAFQFLENGAWLAQKGIVPREKLRGGVGQWWLWSSRFWMLGTVLEAGRLLLQTQGEKTKKVVDSDVDVEVKEPITKALDAGNAPEISSEPAITTANTPTTLTLQASPSSIKGEKDVKIRSPQLQEDTDAAAAAAAVTAKYWRSVATNVAYAPMTLHYSLENGFLGDTSIGVLGLAASVVGLGEVWRQTEGTEV